MMHILDETQLLGVLISTNCRASTKAVVRRCSVKHSSEIFFKIYRKTPAMESCFWCRPGLQLY